MKRRAISSIILCLLTLNFAFAQTLSTQGVIRGATNQAVPDGTYQLDFSIYDAETGGIELWTETHSSVTVTNGVYQVLLGGVTPLDGLAFDTQYYLGMSIDGGAELAPRTALSVSPAALAVNGTANVVPSSGTVGVGTVDPDPGYGLHVKGDGALIGLEGTSTTARIEFKPDGLLGARAGSIGYLDAADELTIRNDNTSGKIVLDADQLKITGTSIALGTDQMNLGVNTAQRAVTALNEDILGINYHKDFEGGMVLGGDVGLGVTPEYSLDILGQTQIREFSNGPSAGTWYMNRDGIQEAFAGLTEDQDHNEWAVMFPDSMMGVTIMSLPDGPFGKVWMGIGTQNPLSTLDIHQTHAALPGGIRLHWGDHNWWIYNNANTDLNFGSNQGANVIIDHQSGAYYRSSDRRIKKNIEPLTGSLQKVLQLKPTQYHTIYQEDTELNETGFIAQDVEEVLPHLVSADNDGLKTLNYDGFIAVTVGAIQELNIQVENQRAEIDQLKEEIAHLRTFLMDQALLDTDKE